MESLEEPMKQLESMKQLSDINKLCLSCRRRCKQAGSVLIAACPRYLQGPKLPRGNWTQLALPL